MNKTILSNIAPLLWVVFTDSLGWGIAFSIFAALILNQQHLFLAHTYSQTGRYMLYEFLLAIYSIFMFFFAPIIGGIADRFGRKPALLLSMVGLTIGFILSAIGCLMNSVTFLIVGRIVSGMTAGSLSVAQAAVIDMSTEKSKSTNLSAVLLANCLGFSLGPILGSILLRYQLGPVGVSTFIVAAIMSSLGFISILFLFKETYRVTIKTKLNIIKNFANIYIAFNNKQVNKLLVNFLFSMVAYGLFFSNLPVFLKRVFVSSDSSIGIILSAFILLLSLSLIFSGKLIFPFFSQKKIVFTAQIIQLIVYTFLSLCIPSLVINYILFAGIALTVGLMYVSLVTLISDAIEENWQGRIMGVVASLFSLTWGIGPLLAGILNHLNKNAAFEFSVVLTIIALFVFYKIRKSKLCN